MNKAEVKEKRKILAGLASKKTGFNKGDHRVTTPRLCVICGRPLSSLILQDNKYVVIYPHNRYHIDSTIILDACTDISSCYRTLRRKGELT